MCWDRPAGEMLPPLPLLQEVFIVLSLRSSGYEPGRCGWSALASPSPLVGPWTYVVVCVGFRYLLTRGGMEGGQRIS